MHYTLQIYNLQIFFFYETKNKQTKKTPQKVTNRKKLLNSYWNEMHYTGNTPFRFAFLMRPRKKAPEKVNKKENC